MKSVFLWAAIALSLVACATHENCATLDWHQLGEHDGVRGRMPSEFKHHQNSCEKNAAPTDQTSYDAGYAAGIAKFCSYENGWREAFAGKIYCGQCPANLERDFLRGYAPFRTMNDVREQAERSNCQVWRGQ
jgi:hypothetical protein